MADTLQEAHDEMVVRIAALEADVALLKSWYAEFGAPVPPPGPPVTDAQG